jgi:hypothetical protein
VAIITILLFSSIVVFGNTIKTYAQDATEETASSETTSNSSDGQEEQQSATEEEITQEETQTEDGVETMQEDASDTENSDTQDEDVDNSSDINTGDAEADFENTNDENTNETNTDNTSATTTVTNENNATSTTDADVTANSGDNEATGNEESSVTTGDAVASANVVNVINTNIFNSTGLFYFLNMIMGNISLDMRNMFSILTGNTAVSGGCALDDEECINGNDTTVTITNDNNAVVNNDVNVTANTGGNNASANGDASVNTGDAYASANVLNLVNTNITNTNYLLMTVNSFNSHSGNIVFPGAPWFDELLAKRENDASGSQTTVTNTNNATVTNDGEVVADTGDNTANGSSTEITTGNANAGVNVVNKVNTNIFGNSLSFLFNIHGSWAGEIFGLPDGMSWKRTKQGVEIFFDDAVATAPAGSTDNLTVTNNNNAEVNNNVSVFALTGENEVTSENGNSTVTTGDANASANIVNVVNTNVLGRNWVLAIFNIFGDWDGNISFGQPNLWVGARALGSSRVRSGTCFDYEVTINNLGDADANNVTLQGIYNTAQQKIERFKQDLNQKLTYHVGRIAHGGTSVVTLPVCLSESLPGETDVITEFKVDSDEDDADYSNNTEAIGITTLASGGSALRLEKAQLEITKKVSRKKITASSTVTYEITIKNTGGPVYNSMLIDSISDKNGKEIHEQRWALDTIRKNETIIVSYDAFFNASTTPGIYTNEAFISGVDRNPDYKHNLGNPVESPVAHADIEVISNEEDAEPEVCKPLLHTYIRYGAKNDSKEVGELQFFLRTLEGYSDLKETKVYDKDTFEAVKGFQRKYADDILNPWGMDMASGYVYYTTQKKINEIWCKDLDFSLTEEQKKEIEHFKNRRRNFIERHIEVSDDNKSFQRYGMVDAENENNRSEENANNNTENTPAIENGNINVNQVASVNKAVANETTLKIWDSFRNSLYSMLNWFGLNK